MHSSVRGVGWLWRVVLAMLLLASAVRPVAQDSSAAVALSLHFHNGSMKPLTFYGNPPRYLHELDIVIATQPTLDDGIASLMTSSGLDWRGVQMVEEDWRTSGDGTFQRQRFYRNAAWMNASSEFRVYPVDARGRRIGSPLTASAGRDDRRSNRDDDFFVRRFSARQIARGCPSQGDCAGARFVVEQLVQLRHNRNAGTKALRLPAQTAALEVEWTANRASRLKVGVTHAAADSVPYGYGFQPALDVTSKPSNGRYFVPGETVTFQMTFRDGQGRRLHAPGALPTYGEFLRDDNRDGLDYYDNPRLNSTVYYALKHREANILVAMSGPTDRLQVARSILDGSQLEAPQAVMETVAVGGYTGVFTGVPSFGVSLGGPSRHEERITDTVSFVIPADAQPGTYVGAVKARRVFGGEASNRAATTTLQIGTTDTTTFTAKTGNCETCHTGPSGLDRILHGVSDRRACFGCHMPLSFEPDNSLDFRVHAVHSRSRRVGADVQNCSLCHLSPPSGPLRGVLPVAGLGVRPRP